MVLLASAVGCTQRSFGVFGWFSIYGFSWWFSRGGVRRGSVWRGREWGWLIWDWRDGAGFPSGGFCVCGESRSWWLYSNLIDKLVNQMIKLSEAPDNGGSSFSG